MKLLKPLSKKSNKQDRERKVLFGLVDYFIKTGKPVGSNTLKDAGFDDLSSATIRNYFANLEEEGYLIQQHTSGGRIPTDKAFREYILDYFESADEEAPPQMTKKTPNQLETREISLFLQRAAEELSSTSQLAAFLSAPVFEQDFIVGIKIIPIDTTRCLCVLITDFGELITETIHISEKLSSFSAKRLEAYFNWRLTGNGKPEHLTREEEELGQAMYNELLLRYVVKYNNFGSEEIHRTGFSKLLKFPEFQDPSLLANSLALFENTHGMKLLLTECTKYDTPKYWIGSDLKTFAPMIDPHCAVVAIPYHVNRQPVGAVGLMGPIRIPYKKLFPLLKEFSETVTKVLTNSLYKFKISLRQPKSEMIQLKNKELIGTSHRLLLEDKTPAHNRRE